MKDKLLKELDNIDQEIKSANVEKNQSEGALKMLREGIKKNFDVETNVEIDTKLTELGTELEDIADQIETKFKDLQENYSWE